MATSTANAYDVTGGRVVWLQQGTGVAQGCPLSTPLFCTVMAEIIEQTENQARQMGLSVRLIAYADDVYVVGRARDLSRALTIFVEALAGVGLRIASEKTKVWCQGQSAADAMEDLQCRIVEKLPVLGCTLYHHDREDELTVGPGLGEEAMHKVVEHVRKTAQVLKDAMGKGLPCQVGGAVLRYVTVGAPQHLMRARRWSPEQLARHDSAVKIAWEDVLEIRLNDTQAELGDLPLKEGGVAFGMASSRAAAAFLTGWRRELWAIGRGTPIHTEDGLRRLLPQIAEEIQAAKADVIAKAPKLNGDPMLDFTKQPPKRLQQMMVQEVMAESKDRLFQSMPTEQRAQVRRSGGTGAGAFTLVPVQGVKTMANWPWRMSVRKRLLCSAPQIVSPQAVETRCLHSGRQGVCGAQLEGQAGLVHAVGCKTGGGVVDGHNEIRDILWAFAKNRIDPKALREQRFESLRAAQLEPADAEEQPGDVLDVVFNHDGQRVAIDVAVVGADQDEARTRAAARRDGVSAEREERDKRRRYAGLAISPCVFEVGGRPGGSAKGVIRALAVMAAGEEGASETAAQLWQEISIALQTATAWQVASAYVKYSCLASAGGR